MASGAITVRAMTPKDWEAVEAIYAEGIATGVATFEVETPTWEKWDEKHRPDCRIVAQREDEVVGWVALTPVSARACYAGVCDVGIYIKGTARRQGVGSLLLNAVIEESEQAGLWTLQSGIFSINQASLKLHEKAGFRMVGRREKIAKRDGIWMDTILMERRSAINGLD